ncbi:hypothetical protein C8R44DRAFT_753979 [Mycena epipterygia]|nr:hypothetical protein C8R44DRAFT_753978 [Mycena epipterygia]KAJ7081674.1 hypothetical protein C8R44DRAFT_753979 [Mycena epipterygia]
MTSKMLPGGLAFEKRKRNESANGDTISTATFYSDGAAAEPVPTAEETHQGEVWQGVTKALATAKKPIPPPSVASHFRDIHLKSLSDYKGAQTALQKAMATNDLFAHHSSNGAIPSMISNHMKMPTYQLVKSAAGIDEDPRVIVALESAVKDLATAEQSAAKFIETVSPDLTRWEPCIKLLKAAFLSELEDLNFEFCAHHEKIAPAKEVQATAVATTRTVAATKDVTKPMSDLISVEVKRQLAEKAMAQNEKKKNAKPARPNAAASTSTTSSTKPKPSSWSSTKHAAGHKAKEDWKQKTTAKQPKGKRPGENDGNGTVANRKGASEKGKKKGKAKAEPQDSSSD